MDYYTRYKMSLRCAEVGNFLTAERMNEIRKAFNEMVGYEGAFDDITNGNANWKWYSAEEATETIEEAMENFSEQFPEVIFTIEGKGEEREDWWINECWDGCVRRHDAVISPPDDYFNWEDFS